MQDATLNAETSAFISNPVICKTLGSAILWERLSATKYPKYMKDSLLNTNEDFDFGEFEALPAALAADDTITNFVFTFTEPGIYVFADSRNQAKQMIISIMGENQGCPGNTAFSPKTYSALLKVGASMRGVMEPPDWYMFFGVLFAGCCLILITVAVISYIVKRDWRQKRLPKVAYKDFNYESVERSDVTDKRAIVSINDNSESFMIRHMGREESDEDEMEYHHDDENKKRKKKRKKTKDL